MVSICNLMFAWPGRPPLLDVPVFELGQGERLFLHGPSGSGKSTLLGLLGGVLLRGSGNLRVLGTELCTLNSRQRDRFRADHLGIIFQMFNLLPYLSVIENVVLPVRFSKARAQAVLAAGGMVPEAERLLAALGLGRELVSKPVSELSVGQQQRVAAARALIGSPELIIADEPTSALDEDHRSRFIDLLMAECQARQAGLIFVSHDRTLSGRFDRSIDLSELNRCAQTEAC